MDTVTLDLQSLAARAEGLEKQNRLLRRGGLAVLLAAASLILMGQAPPISTVQAQTQTNDPNAMIAFRGGSGSHLLEVCQAAVKMGPGENGTLMLKTAPDEIRGAVNGSYCNGYVSGVLDTLTNLKFATASGYESALTRSCVPSDAGSDQLARVVAKYLNDNPATLNVPAGMLIVSAMNDAFPCK